MHPPRGVPREICACGPPAKDRSNHGSNHQSSQGGHRRLRVRGLGQRLCPHAIGPVLRDGPYRRRPRPRRGRGPRHRARHGVRQPHEHLRGRLLRYRRCGHHRDHGRGEPGARRDAPRPGQQERRHLQVHHPADRRARLPGHPAGGLEPRGHPDLRGPQALRHARQPRARQRHHARHRALQVRLGRAPGRRSAQCARPHHRRARRQRDRRMELGEHLRHPAQRLLRAARPHRPSAQHGPHRRGSEERGLRDHQEEARNLLRHRHDGQAHLRGHHPR